MRETRNAPRISAKHQGIVSIVGRPEIPCTLRNLSNLGAQLAFQNPTILPRAFQLRFDGLDQRVSVIWQSGRLAGVRFQSPLKNISAPKKRLWPWGRK
jgi:hypothetical protein